MLDYKRVACLYRVSTKSQVEDDDIPMQKNACKEFIAAQPDWKLQCEYSEKGVSGYKKTAAQRDVLQQIKSDALSGRFDILLVFMFDRLGRREDETPFVVEWFVSKGIEVWSVKEGQQRFDNRVDKLLNYIRFWQSGGESEKTGIRVAEKHQQMTKEGKFRGGVAPYGYKNVKSGIENHKGREVKMPVVYEPEADVVRLVYKLADENGYGGFRIASYLNDKNIPTRKNSLWTLSVINYMLRNPIYKGYLTYGKTSAKRGGGRTNPDEWLLSEKPLPELQIISEEVWDRVQIIRKARTPKEFLPENINYSNYPLSTKSELLFIGFVHCGHCGSSMSTFQSTQKWNNKKNGNMRTTKATYKCTRKGAGVKCEGQHTYIKDKIEQPVLAEVYHYLDLLEQVDYTKKIDNLKKQKLSIEQKKVYKFDKEIEAVQDEISQYKKEVLLVIKGESKFTAELLTSLISESEEKLMLLENEKTKLLNELDDKKTQFSDIERFGRLIPSWKAEFEKADISAKKMLLSNLIQDVIVKKGEIEVFFKFPIVQFLEK